MRTAKLSDEQIDLELKAVLLWRRRGKEIWRRFEFQSFAACMHFVNQVANAAEARDHHPDMDIRYSAVTLILTTHDSGGLTVKDFELASEVDCIAAQASGVK